MVNKFLISGYITTAVSTYRNNHGDMVCHFLLHHRKATADHQYVFNVQAKHEKIIKILLHEVKRGDFLLLDGHMTAALAEQPIGLWVDMVYNLSRGEKIEDARNLRMAHLAQEMAKYDTF